MSESEPKKESEEEELLRLGDTKDHVPLGEEPKTREEFLKRANQRIKALRQARGKLEEEQKHARKLKDDETVNELESRLRKIRDDIGQIEDDAKKDVVKKVKEENDESKTA